MTYASQAASLAQPHFTGKRTVAAGLWPAIAFRLKTLDLVRGTDRANSGSPLLTGHHDQHRQNGTIIMGQSYRLGDVQSKETC